MEEGERKKEEQERRGGEVQRQHHSGKKVVPLQHRSGEEVVRVSVCIQTGTYCPYTNVSDSTAITDHNHNQFHP